MLIACTGGISLANIWVSAHVSPIFWVKNWHIGMAGVEDMLFKLSKPNQCKEQGNTVSFYCKREKRKKLKYIVLSDIF